MGSLIGLVLKAMNWQQVLTFIVGTVGVYAIQHFVPAGQLQTLLLGADANLVALIAIVFRTPSAQGGTVSTAGK
jgi:hypothetical protein